MESNGYISTSPETLKLWDAHAHIQEPWFSSEEIKALMDKATRSSIEGIINVVSTPTMDAYNHGIELQTLYTLIHLNFGLQPTEVSSPSLDIFKDTVLANKEKICAIGEVGLDYYWVKDKAKISEQQKTFIEIISFTNELQKPLVIHSRKAEDDCLDLLEEYAEVPVLMHGVEATLDQIKRIIDLNYKLSIPTSVCNRKKYAKIAVRTPLEHILLETDSPFQLPFDQPKVESSDWIKNDPTSLVKSVEKIAVLKDLDIIDVAYVTSQNTKKFFNLF